MHERNVSNFPVPAGLMPGTRREQLKNLMHEKSKNLMHEKNISQNNV